MEISSPAEPAQEQTEEHAPALPPRMWRVVMTLALPVLAQQLLLLIIQQSDRYLAGHLKELAPTESGTAEAYQSAQTTAQYLSWFITSYIFLVSVGSTALVARFTGAGDRKRAVHTLNQSILLGVCFGVVGSVLGYTGREIIVSTLELKDSAAVFATAYLAPMFLFLTFQVVEASVIACLVGAGDTRTGLYVMSGVAVVNLPMAWGLCLGVGPLPALGFAGISLGTALSHVIGCLAVLTVVACGRFGLKLHPRLLWPNPELLRRLLRVSIPAGIDSLSVTLCQLWFLSLVNRLGDVAAGAHGIALGWEALGYLSGGAFSTTAMTLVGQNLGAGRPDLAAKGGWTAFAFGCGVMSAMGVIFYLLARPMFLLYCPFESQTPIVEEGVAVLKLIAFVMPALASAIIFTSALRAAGDRIVPVVFSWIGFLGVRIPLAYLLSQESIVLGPLGEYRCANLGLYGAWLAMCGDIGVRGLFFFLRFAGGRWKTMRV
ncbi:MAG TPA: MATE family efflux transporter [Gemmataceae bacterium]|nr:MATE family efflux transporter [Gemmataceae bacterium]